MERCKTQGKVIYPSEKMVWKAIAKMRDTNGDVYKCKECGGWHMTSSTDVSIKNFKMRKSQLIEREFLIEMREVC